MPAGESAAALLRSHLCRHPAGSRARRKVHSPCRASRRVERLAYTRTQAAAAPGVSRSTFVSRVLPLIETIDTPPRTQPFPVDELERPVRERRRPASRRAERTFIGRRPGVPGDIVRRIVSEYAAGKGLGQVARDLDANATPTAHGGAQWWPSTVRAVLARANRSRLDGARARRAAPTRSPAKPVRNS